MRSRSCCPILRSFPRMRLRIVARRTVNRPRLFFPLICVKPRKSNVSGFPSPLRLRFSSANLPNSIRRVLSGCSSSPNLARRSRNFPESDRRPSDTGIRRWYRPHNGQLSPHLAPISGARRSPRDRKRSAGKRWRVPVKSPNPEVYLFPVLFGEPAEFDPARLIRV